jgi:hypothetical protein
MKNYFTQLVNLLISLSLKRNSNYLGKFHFFYACKFYCLNDTFEEFLK